MQWIPKQIVSIGEDFHSQVGDDKVRTTLYKVRWEGYDKKNGTHSEGWDSDGHAHVNQTYHDIVRMWRQFHGCPASGDGIERVFFSVGKQYDTVQKKTMDKTLEVTLKTSDDDDTYRKRK
jgi:hypothetical protein